MNLGNPNNDQSSTQNLKAIWLMVISMSAFALADSIIRVASLTGDGGASAGLLLSSQGIAGLVIFSTLMKWRGDIFVWKDILHPVVFARTISDTFAGLCMITALTLLPVGEVSAILQVQPLVVTLGAALFLKEHVGRFRWGAIIIGFIGVMIILRPSPQLFEPASILVIAAVFGLASRDLLSRKIPNQISTSSITIYVCLAALPAGIILHYAMANFGTVTPITELWAITWFHIITSSIVGITGYFILTQAMRLGEISAVAPYRYSRLPAAFFFSWLLLSERPDLITIIGSIIIVAAGIFVVYRERKIRKN